jgi:TPR repeat protein
MKRLQAAAEKGDASAQFNLGVLYDNRLDDNGHPIGSNRAQALKWLQMAAEQGMARAQAKLAEVYAGGAKATGDDAKACFWFLLAADGSNGIHRLNAQSGYARAAANLTKAEIARTTKLARGRKPSTRSAPTIGDIQPAHRVA